MLFCTQADKIAMTILMYDMANFRKFQLDLPHPPIPTQHLSPTSWSMPLPTPNTGTSSNWWEEIHPILPWNVLSPPNLTTPSSANKSGTKIGILKISLMISLELLWKDRKVVEILVVYWFPKDCLLSYPQSPESKQSWMKTKSKMKRKLLKKCQLGPRKDTQNYPILSENNFSIEMIIINLPYLKSKHKSYSLILSQPSWNK